MIRAIIVDDEEHCITRLQDMLRLHCRETVTVETVCSNLQDTISILEKNKPDLVFLDIELGETTGIDFLRNLPLINFDVIFTTAYDKYAIQAIKFSAIDYLLKPIDKDELIEAVNRFNKIAGQKELSQKFENLFKNLSESTRLPTRKISVPSGNGLLFIEVGQIIRCEADVNYTTIYLQDKQKVLVAKTLKEFEEMLGEHDFFRIHNSHLVNLNCIKSYYKGKGGTVTLSDNTRLEVSSRRKELFLKRMVRF